MESKLLISADFDGCEFPVWHVVEAIEIAFFHHQDLDFLEPFQFFFDFLGELAEFDL